MLLQLKLHDKVNNSFEYCEVHIPFFNRGTIAQYEASPTTGSVSLDEQRKRLIWKIGTKFTSKNLEVALPATLNFTSSPLKTPQKKPAKAEQSNEDKMIDASANFFHDPLVDSFTPFIHGGFEDPFCVGQNCYALLRFKMLDFTLTGISIDTKKADSITISPKSSSKVAVTVERNVVSEKFIIWNSLADHVKYSI